MRSLSENKNNSISTNPFFKIITVLLSILITVFSLELLLQLKSGTPEDKQVTSHGDLYWKIVFDSPVSERSHKGTKWYSYDWKSDKPEFLFPVKKNEDTARIFIVGESAATLLYKNSAKIFKNDQYLEEKLENRFPGMKIEIYNFGIPGIYSSQICRIIKNLKTLSPDYILITMGNNVYKTPLWTSLRYKHPPFSRLLYHNSWIFSLICDSFYRLIALNKDYDTEYFLKDCEEIAEELSHEKIPFAFTTLPSNIMDLPPKKFYSPDRNIIQARWLLESKKYEETIEFCRDRLPDYDAQNSIEDSVPSLLYIIASALQLSEKNEEALEYYEKVLSNDYSIRAPNEVNNGLIRIAENYSSDILDAKKALSALHPYGFTGLNYFFDSCHWYEPFNTVILNEWLNILNSRTIAGVAPVNLSLNTDYQTNLINHCTEDRKVIAISNAIMGNSELAVMQMRHLSRKCSGYFANIIASDGKEMALSLSKKEDFKSCKIDIQRQWFRVYAYAAEAARQEGDLPHAEDLIKKAVTMEPGKSTALNVFQGFLALNLGNYTKAELFFKRVGLSSEDLNLIFQ